MCGISLDCHEMWMLARMVARTVFLMRIRRRRKGDVSRGKGGGGPDDKKGSWGGGSAGCVGGYSSNKSMWTTYDTYADLPEAWLYNSDFQKF